MDDKLPIIEVTADNFAQVWPCLTRALKQATFVAIDCELSGLGTRSKINFSQLDIRYKNLVELAQSHAVVALGISCFSCHSVSTINTQNGAGEGQIRSHDYMVQTFNVLTMCLDPFTVECDSVKFLHTHGFDFNKLYAKGVLYYKGCDQERKKEESLSVRHLFTKILEHRKPLVLHNGLIDLVFLYQSFYCDLPKTNDTFAADLDDLFPLGVYDTKYLAEFHQAVPATYLEYLFKKMQLKNLGRQRRGDWHVRLRFPPYPSHAPNVDWYTYSQIFSYKVELDQDKRELCQNFAFHGFCHKDKCGLSHNINRVVKELQSHGTRKQGDSKHVPARSNSMVHIIQAMTRGREEPRQPRQRKRKSGNGGKREPCEENQGKSCQENGEECGERDSKRPRLCAVETEKDAKSEADEDNLEIPRLTPKESNGEAEIEENEAKTHLSPKETSQTQPVTPHTKEAPHVNPKETNKDSENESNADKNIPVPVPESRRSANGHRAGYDAFMTGFIFASIVSGKGCWTSLHDPFTSANIGLSDQVNRVYLMGKNIPFLIRTGAYTSKSSKHCSKIEKVRRCESVRNV